VRQRAFAADSAWGSFSARIDDDVAAFAPYGPIACGVCGAPFDGAQAKADHLRAMHGAAVRAVEAPWGESMWEWSR